MSRFGHETPMDFEFQNGTGAVDVRSPFVKLSNNPQRFGTPFADASKRRPQTANDSPSRSAKIGGSQSSPSKPLPPNPPTWNSLFNTPRKPQAEIDDSSAGETPVNDSDATPDTKNLRSALSRFDAQSAPALPSSPAKTRGSPTKERPSSRRELSFPQHMFGKVKKIWSPGRGEISRKEQNPDGVEKSVVKRRKRQVDRRIVRSRRRSVSGSEADSDYQPHRSPRKTSSQQSEQVESEKPHWMPSFFRFIASQPMLPHILSWYAQLMFNVFLLCFCGYVIYSVWAAVQGDIDRNTAEEASAIMSQINECARHYTTNNCESPPYPGLVSICAKWEDCMRQNPKKVARGRISAATFAGIYNSFVEEISWKAIIFTFIITFGTFSFGNLAFGAFRSKAEQYQPYPAQWQPPPTPQRSFSGQDGSFYTGTPWHQPGPEATLEPSGGFGQIDGRGSPVRRLAYN